MLDQNCMGVKVGTPLKEYFDGVLALDDNADDGGKTAEAKATAGQLWNLLPGVCVTFIPVLF
jgi:hypothetical protein